MSMWKYTGVNKYTSVLFVEFLEDELANHFQMKSINKWKNVWVMPNNEDAEKEIVPDFVWHPGFFPIISLSAAEVLKPLIHQHVQLLPLRLYPDEVHQLFAVNVLTTRDYLDEETSEFRYRANGEIMNIAHYAFKENIVIDAPIFKLPRYTDLVFISDEFKTLAEKEGLIGLGIEKMK